MARTKRIRNKGKLQTNGTKRKSRTKRVRDKSGRKVGGMRLGGVPMGPNTIPRASSGESSDTSPPPVTNADSFTGCMRDLGRVAVDSCSENLRGCFSSGDSRSRVMPSPSVEMDRGDQDDAATPLEMSEKLAACEKRLNELRDMIMLQQSEIHALTMSQRQGSSTAAAGAAGRRRLGKVKPYRFQPDESRPPPPPMGADSVILPGESDGGTL